MNRTLLFKCPIIILFAAYATACVPDKEVVDCTQNPDSPVCINNTKDPTPAKIYVDPPFGVSFTCVLLGCEETLTLQVENRGGGSISMSDIQLENDDENTPLDYSMVISMNKEFDDNEESLEATEETPVAATPDQPVYIHITYTPTDGLDDLATLSLRWFDGRKEYADAEVKTVELSVSARVIEMAEASLETTAINFGFTPVDTPLTETIRLTNTSTADAILTVLDARLTDGSSEAFQIGVGWTPFVNPDQTIEIPIIFAPTEAAVSLGAIELTTNDSVGSYTIPLKGTAIADARIQILEPTEGILDFDDVRADEVGTRIVTLANIGGAAASVAVSVDSAEGIFTTSLPEGPLAIAPMSEVTFEVYASPTEGGDLSGQITITPENESEPFVLSLLGFCTAPEIVVAESLAFAPIVETWTSETHFLNISNSGAGELLITDLQFDVGSSSQIRLANSLPLPLSISPGDDPLEVPLVVTATNLGELEAALLISHNGLRGPIQRVPITGTVVTCEEGCPTANGVPNCMSGTCEIDSCTSGWHDQNASATDGCECGEDRNGLDIGSVCSSGSDLGNLGDCGSNYPSEAVRSGTLHNDSDIDLYFVRTEDAGGGCDFFGDSARASVQLVSGPEGLALCAIIRETGTGCGGYTTYFDENLCGQNSYSRDGSWGADDNQELTAWVLWRPGAAPSCGTYSLKFRGED